MSPVSKGKAEEITAEFLRDFPVVFQRIAIRFRRNAEELYGKEYIQSEATMKAGYSSKRGVAPNGRAYDGRIDVLLDNITDRNDLIASIKHEAFGHFGINTFSLTEKSALLHSIIESRSAPGLELIWENVQKRYSDRSIDVQAEEVFARAFEHINLSSLLKLDSSFGADAFRETCLDRTKSLQLSDLLHIASMVAQGLHDGSRTQQHFPQDDALVYAGRMQNILLRTISTDISYIFYNAADAALKQALKSLTMNWREVENETITQSIGNHGQKPDVVLQFLLENSPGAVTIEQQLELRKKISGLAPLPEAQFARGRNDSNDREFTP